MQLDYLSKLNDQQRAAVEYCDGPQLVIAGAGSGKTRVLTYKIVHLLTKGIQPWRIMALTFTNKAAREMRERIQALVGEKTASKLWMGTFHSIFARILRINADKIGFKSDFTIYDAADSKQLIKMIIKDMDLDDKVYKPSIVMSAISNAKNALMSPERYAMDRDIREADRRARRDRMAEVYRAYVNRCHIAGAMDFDDLLYYTNVLMRDCPDVLHHYQEYFSYVLVDEYQDTNFAQHMIVSQICKATQKLCVVGDDAQSIYSFRGANIRNILNLKNAYPTLETFKLERNYRSTKTIINAAGSLIDKNTEQIRKHVFSLGEEGDPIEVAQGYSDFEEAYLVANRITARKRSTGDGYDEFAVLYRTNAQSRVLEEALRKRSIPYRIYGGLSFYQRKEVKDAVAYFRLSINPHDDEALKRVINFPARGIGETTVNKISRAAIDRSVSMWDVICDPDTYGLEVNKGTRAKIDGFRTLIDSFRRMNNEGADAAKLAGFIISETRMASMLYTDQTPENISKIENLNEIISGAREFVEGKIEEGNTENIFMADYLSEVALATDQDDKESDPSEKVTLMTIHAAKGLEFGNIFIVGAEEDLLPSAMSKDNPSEVEEERRLLYVAITRAKRFCMISYAAQRFRNGSTEPTRPSRFLREIDKSYLRFSQGTPESPEDDMQRARSSFHSGIGGWGHSSSRSSYSGFGRQSSRPTTPASPAPPRPGASPISTNYHSGPSPMDHSVAGACQHLSSELTPGMRIEHPRFGKGTITEVDTSQPDHRIRVTFDNVEAKTLLLKFAKFSIL